MTKNIQTLLLFGFLMALIACNRSTTKPLHYTEKFAYKDRDGNENNFYGFKNIDSARHWATIEKKRILVLFSCYSCMATRDNEWRTLDYLEDNKKIQDNFIILWVPVDDKNLAEDPDQTFFVAQKEMTLNTVGDRNWYWQINLTKISTQPVICVIDTAGKKYGLNLSYTRDKKEVSDFFKIALDANTAGQQIVYPTVPKTNTLAKKDSIN